MSRRLLYFLVAAAGLYLWFRRKPQQNALSSSSTVNTAVVPWNQFNT